MERLLLRGYEWVRDKNGIYEVGLTEEAARELGDIYEIQTDQHHYFEKGEKLVCMEGQKSGIALYAPFDCTVIKLFHDWNGQPEMPIVWLEKEEDG